GLRPVHILDQAAQLVAVCLLGVEQERGPRDKRPAVLPRRCCSHHQRWTSNVSLRFLLVVTLSAQVPSMCGRKAISEEELTTRSSPSAAVTVSREAATT